ncbi:MAG: hypothetical protein JW976_11130 [Syntrophaceae bacterium]|nr:hypothetical protein [Syntrophaceae bacterium]
MFKNEKFWYLCAMPGAVAGWIFILYGLLFPFHDKTVKILWLAVVFIWGIGHLLELAASIPIGKSKGIPVRIVVIKTIVFGITWWLPLKLGFISETR